MNFLDLYYRVSKDLHDRTIKEKEVNKILNTIIESSGKDFLETIRNKCLIEEDWISFIEQEIPYVEKAIGEGREFITSEGDVIPIEKVKHVSRSSTEHLAKHSNLISHYNEGQDIIPDKIFMEEKLSEFAVYENRFLYFLLVNLRDFVNFKYEKILELGNSYYADFFTRKNVKFSKKIVYFELKYKEENFNDKQFTIEEKTQKLIERIEDIQHNIISLLSTELMQVVSKVAMIKAPITKTNVLRMDNNFKHAVKLYEYISSYEKDGYTVEKIKNTMELFTPEMLANIAEIVNLSSFISYENGNGLNALLEENYRQIIKEELLKKQEEDEKRLNELKRKVNKSGKEIDEYLVLLEDKNASLKKDSDQLKIVSEELSQRTEQVNKLSQEKLELINSNSVLEIKNNELNEQMGNLKVESERKISEAKNQCNLELSEKERVFNEQKNRIISECVEKTNKVNEENAFLRGRVKGLLMEKGITESDVDYSSKENFLQLEQEYLAFIKIFNKEWKNTKKKIRLNHLGKVLSNEIKEEK